MSQHYRPGSRPHQPIPPRILNSELGSQMDSEGRAHFSDQRSWPSPHAQSEQPPFQTVHYHSNHYGDVIQYQYGPGSQYGGGQQQHRSGIPEAPPPPAPPPPPPPLPGMWTEPGDRGQGEASSEPLESEGIAQKVYDNRDLLAVSRGVASLPMPAVGTVLGNLDDSDITAIEEDPDIPLPSDKMYHLLYTWKTKGKGTHTWDHLLECLKKLPSPEELVERIKNRLRQIIAKPVVFTPSDCGVEAACKELENVCCSDLDLECMSVKALQHSVHVIGACLLLDEDLVKKIACSSAYPNRRSRIYDLFLKWKRKTGVHSTLPALLACLTWLENEPLLKDVKQYIVDTHRCLSIPKAKLQVCSGVPSTETSSNVHGTLSPNLSLEIPGYDDSDATPSSGLWPQPFEETIYERHKSMMVFSSGRTEPLSTSFREEFAALQSEFSFLQSMVYEKLNMRGVAVDTVQMFVNSLCVSQQENIPYFNKHMQEMIAHSSLKGVFGFLTRIGVWSFLNFRILEEIVKHFDLHDLQHKITQYQEKVNSFKKTAKLSDFLQEWPGQGFYKSEGMIPVFMKFEAAWPDCTLSEVAEKEDFLANEFLLHKSIFQLANATSGSVAVLWLVPFSVLTAVKAIIRKRLPDLRKAKIKELIIGNLLFVQDGVVLEPVSYPHLYKYSIEHPDKFWGERAKKFLVWDEPFTKAVEDDRKRWFTGGKLNVTRSVLDRHVKENPDKVAIIWERNEPGTNPRITYRELYEMTCRVANVLKSKGIDKGDVVTIYMPTMPLTVACMLACARIGAIHSVIFATVKGEPLIYRIEKAKPTAVITTTTAMIGRKKLDLKANIDEVLESGNCKVKVKHVFVASFPESQLRQLPSSPSATEVSSDIPPGSLNIDLQKEMASMSPECEPVSMDSEDSLFLAFTSGSSADPKMITHSHAGYLLYAAVTHKYVFDYQPGDVFACVVDLAWITGHSYVVYGPLCNGATTVLFSSTASYPNPGRYWDMVERLKVNQLYISASAIKGLMKAGDELVRKYDRSSLRTIGSVGEPLHGDVWKWYQNVVGQMRCVLVDTWWQTEVGGIAIAPLPVHENRVLKPGFTMKPFFGVQPVIVNDQMEEVGPNCEGELCLRMALPGMGREVDRSRETFQSTYYKKDLYQTFDLAYCDEDGDFCIKGRVLDRIGTDLQGGWLNVQEIEHVMTMLDETVKEALLVAYDSKDTKEQKTCAFVEFKKKVSKEEERAVVEKMREKLTSDAGASKELKVPSKFVVVDQQPKTYSHKAQRYLLRQIASEIEDSDKYTHPAGDTTTRDYLYMYEVSKAGEDCPDLQ